jgi:hypothetical protein
MLLSTLTTAEWLVVAGSGVLLVLSLVPVIWASWRFVQMSDDEYERTVAQVERFADLRDRARRSMR